MRLCMYIPVCVDKKKMDDFLVKLVDTVGQDQKK